MFERILIPLDGSERSQAVLTHLRGLLTAFDPHLVLLAVVSQRDVLRADDLAIVAEAEQRAADYLEEVRSQLAQQGLTATGVVRVGPAEYEILEAARELECDLIAMASHGYGGLSRLWYGSTAERVLRGSETPVLLVKSFTGGEEPADTRYPRPLEPLHWRNVLVPLDGSANAESALPAATRLAQKAGAKITLMRATPVIVHSGFLYDVQVNAAYDTQGERDYLAGIAKRLRALGLEVDVVVARGPATEAIASVVKGRVIDLVVMSTHGRTGLRRWLLGSVAEQLVRTMHTPVLLSRVPND